MLVQFGVDAERQMSLAWLSKAGKGGFENAASRQRRLNHRDIQPSLMRRNTLVVASFPAFKRRAKFIRRYASKPNSTSTRCPTTRKRSSPFHPCTVAALPE